MKPNKPNTKQIFTNRRRARAVTQHLLVAAAMAAFGVGKSSAATFSYRQVAALGQTAPGEDQYISYFETGQINNLGDVIFGAEVASIPGGVDLGEGTFLTRFGNPVAIVLPGTTAPGGGTFLFNFSPTALNDWGDGAASLQLNSFQLPEGTDVGLYRYSGFTHQLSAVVVPGTTLAPNGRPFQGVSFQPVLNNRGQLLFNGLISTSQGIVPAQGMGLGMYVADQAGHISNVVSPGDPAPGGGTFDFAEVAWINDIGDVAFGAHVAGEECVGADPTPAGQSFRIFCGDNVYVKLVPSSQAISVAHQGNPAPGGGTYRHAWGPVINNLRQVLFVGDLTAPPNNDVTQGLYLYNGWTHTTVPVIRPGDSLPDGTHLATVSDFSTGHHINNAGQIAFLALEDSGAEALWVKSGNSYELVAKTGQSIAGVGTIANFDVESAPLFGGALNNDLGQIFFAVNLTSGSTAMVIATPARELSKTGSDAE
jgi:hypothetical protein